MKQGCCQNVECENGGIVDFLYLVILIDKYNKVSCYWCVECVERDKKYIKKIYDI